MNHAPPFLMHYDFPESVGLDEREKRLKYHGSALSNVKLRINNTLQKGGAG